MVEHPPTNKTAVTATILKLIRLMMSSTPNTPPLFRRSLDRRAEKRNAENIESLDT
jgi:hypothetical protein